MVSKHHMIVKLGLMQIEVKGTEHERDMNVGY